MKNGGVIVVCALWLGSVLPVRAALPSDDVVFKAMNDEMARNMRRLRMDDLPGPYYLAYTVREGTQAFITASFGALEGSQASSFLEARVQVRVGTVRVRVSTVQFVQWGYSKDACIGAVGV